MNERTWANQIYLKTEMGIERNNLADFVWLTSWEYIVLSYFICEQKWTRPAGSTVRSDKVVNIR